MQYVETTLETVSAFLPEDFDIPGLIDTAASYIPTQIDFASSMQFLLIFSVASLVLGALGKVIFGKRSSLNHSISSTMGILFIYAATVCIYTFQPWKIMQLLSPLPFVTFYEDFIVLCPVIGVSMSIFCTQALSLVILSFLVNLLDSLLPKGNHLLSWYGYRFITIVLAMVAHFLVHWMLKTYLPSGLVTYAPVVLLGILLSMLLLGVLNLIFSVLLTIVNPIFGGIYTFFFSNFVGKQLTKSIFSSALICCLFVVLEKLGYTIICISPSAIVSFLPLGIALLLLWHLLGHIL